MSLLDALRKAAGYGPAVQAVEAQLVKEGMTGWGLVQYHLNRLRKMRSVKKKVKTPLKPGEPPKPESAEKKQDAS